MGALTGHVQVIQAQTVEFKTTAGVMLRSEVVAGGLEHPWGIEELPGGSLLVTERPGRLRLVSPDGTLSGPINGVPDVYASGQGGLLDVALSLDFVDTGLVYLSFAERAGPASAGTSVARAQLLGWQSGAPELTNVEVIFRMVPTSSGGRHFGSRIVVHPDKSVFITTGDRGDAPRAQDPLDHAGKVIRITPDGAAPGDNPFFDKSAVDPRLWSLGHRNIQGADLDPETGLLWTVEHGARGGDEINQPEPGLNYGWPVISYGRHYSGAKIGRGHVADGYEQPRYYWDPSIAPSGLAIYDSDLIQGWRGDILVGALKDQMLVRLERNASGDIIGEERLLKGVYGRIRDVEITADGRVLLLTDDDNGQIIQLVPSH